MTDKAQHIENIQDILMGSEMQKFQIRFDELSRNLKDIETYFDNAIKLFYTKLQKKLRDSTQMLELKIDTCISQRHEEKVQLRGAMYTSIDALEDEIFKQQELFFTHLKSIKATIIDETHEIAREIEIMKEQLRTILSSDIDALSNEKVSREMMSQTLLNGVRSIHLSKQSLAKHQVTQHQPFTNQNSLREYIEHEKQELKNLAENINHEKKELYHYLEGLKEVHKDHQEIIDVEVSDKVISKQGSKSSVDGQSKV